jgi:hypothetical protein
MNQLTQEAARPSEGLEGVEEQAERTLMEVTRLKNQLGRSRKEVSGPVYIRF